MNNPQNPQQQRQIQIKDNFAGGEYANFMQIGHNREEMIMIFANILPPTGRVVSKVIISPGHMKRIIGALQENLKKYEVAFGEVKEAESPKTEIGFKSGE